MLKPWVVPCLSEIADATAAIAVTISSSDSHRSSKSGSDLIFALLKFLRRSRIALSLFSSLSRLLSSSHGLIACSGCFATACFPFILILRPLGPSEPGGLLGGGVGAGGRVGVCGGVGVGRGAMIGAQTISTSLSCISPFPSRRPISSRLALTPLALLTCRFSRVRKKKNGWDKSSMTVRPPSGPTKSLFPSREAYLCFCLAR